MTRRVFLSGLTLLLLAFSSEAQEKVVELAASSITMGHKDSLNADTSELGKMKATSRKNWVKISWTVEMEDPGTVYEIQRSDNGIAFSTVYLQAGDAGAGQTKDYQWTDASPLQGTSFYRLKIREPEGMRYSASATVLRPDKNPFISKVYISRGNLLIETNNPKKQRVAVRILDQQGVAILQTKYDLVREKSEIRIPFGSVANAGVYIVTVTTPDGNVYVNRFVKPN